jgi:cell fate (sporulation/competence/biofilm development) regulator YmcA (YheA/YmcA/DUF963 family)
MNNELKLQVEKVKTLLKNHPDVIEYNSLATQVHNSKYIKETELKLKQMQKDLVHLTNDLKQNEYEVLKTEYQKLKKEFDEYPLYSNYLQAKEKVNDLLIQISEILSSL